MNDGGEMESPRVLLADDLPEMLETITQLLPDDFEIVGYAQDGEEAIQAATTYNPDVLVLDIEMPFRNGIQVASHLRNSGCKARVIFLTAHEDPDYVDAASSVGALGYVVKSRIATDLLPAIREVLQGRRFISSFQLT
jgi:DNA-binding NarL/FixJ family response regulator